MNQLFILFTLSLISLNSIAEIPLPVANPQNDDERVCQKITTEELETYNRLIEHFGGVSTKSINNLSMDRNSVGLQNYLKQVGIRNFSANEIKTPNSETDALKCGLENLIPPQCIWPNAGALLNIFERMREKIASPIYFRNWWRPTCYNTLVDGAPASDHLLAKSFDIDFKNANDRAQSLKFLCEELWKKGENIQVGMGCTSLHVGLASPKGKRFWFYSSMKDCPVKNVDNCWSY